MITGLTTGWMFVYTIQPVVKPVVQPVSQPVVSCKRGFTVEMLQAEICRREQFLKRGGSLRSPIKGGRERRPPISLGGRKLEVLLFHMV